MEFSCFTFQQQPFTVQLDTKGNYVNCVIRGFPLVVGPEELVRQSLLVFLTTQCLDLYPHQITIAVEHEDMDIAIYLDLTSIDTNFCPDIPPILVIETKNKDVLPLDTEKNEVQLTDYLRLKKCNAGVLINCGVGFAYEKQGQSYQKSELSDLSHIIEIIRQENLKQCTTLDEQYKIFSKAKSGNFQSFKELVEMYGCNANSTIKFVYQQGGGPVQVPGFLFKLKGDTVHFRTRGILTKNSQAVTESEFRQLISIKRL